MPDMPAPMIATVDVGVGATSPCAKSAPAEGAVEGELLSEQRPVLVLAGPVRNSITTAARPASGGGGGQPASRCGKVVRGSCSPRTLASRCPASSCRAGLVTQDAPVPVRWATAPGSGKTSASATVARMSSSSSVIGWGWRRTPSPVRIAGLRAQPGAPRSGPTPPVGSRGPCPMSSKRAPGTASAVRMPPVGSTSRSAVRGSPGWASRPSAAPRSGWERSRSPLPGGPGPRGSPVEGLALERPDPVLVEPLGVAQVRMASTGGQVLLPVRG